MERQRTSGNTPQRVYTSKMQKRRKARRARKAKAFAAVVILWLMEVSMAAAAGAVVAAIIVPLALLKRGRSRMYWLTVVVLVFSWIHVVFLPMVVSAMYLISLLAIGRFLRKRVFFRGTVWERPYFSFYMDFLFGASFAIVVYCLLSALGVGKIAWMRLIVYALGGAALGFVFSSIS